MKVLIIEDDENFKEAVSMVFKIHWAEAQILMTSHGKKGIDILKNETIDLVMLDLGLPDISGFDVLKQIRLFSHVPIIILTVMSDESSIVKGLEMGADDYIAKPVGQLELLARVKARIRNRGIISEETLTCGSIRLEPATAQVFCSEKEIHLTPTEYRILYTLMQQPGHLVSDLTLARQVWNRDYPQDYDLIKVYVRRLREKIEADPANPELIITKRGIGHFIVGKEAVAK